jgi:hypothetical protein
MPNFNSPRVYTIVISHPELNNYIQIKKYAGKLIIIEAEPLEFISEYDNETNMTYLTEFDQDYYLDSSKFKIKKGVKILQIQLALENPFEGAIFTIETY